MQPQLSRRKQTESDDRHLLNADAKGRAGRGGGNARQAAAERGERCSRYDRGTRFVPTIVMRRAGGGCCSAANAWALEAPGLF